MVKLVDGPHAGEPAYISILLNPFPGLNTVTLASIFWLALYCIGRIRLNIWQWRRSKQISFKS
jgi:hypothetical protein